MELFTADIRGFLGGNEEKLRLILPNIDWYVKEIANRSWYFTYSFVLQQITIIGEGYSISYLVRI